MVEEVVYIHIFLKIEWKSVNLSNLALESRKKKSYLQAEVKSLVERSPCHCVRFLVWAGGGSNPLQPH